MRIDDYPVFRPPAEANSFIVRAALGCPHNSCAFCGMYKQTPFRELDDEEILAQVPKKAGSRRVRRVFLADGDVMAFESDRLLRLINELRQRLSGLMRLSVYANGSSIAGKTPGQLRDLKEAGLHTVYIGLESGDPVVLRRMRKPETLDRIVEGCRMAAEAGLRTSVMFLLGLGGVERTAEHAAATAAALNRIQPRLLSALRVIPVPGTELNRWVETGEFRELSEFQVVSELLAVIEMLDLKSTVFRADHSSNIVPVEARLPADRDALVGKLRVLLDSGQLDRKGPGARPLWL